MFVAMKFFLGLIKTTDKHPVSRDCGGTWYPQAYKFIKLKHHLHFFVKKNQKSIIERTM